MEVGVGSSSDGWVADASHHLFKAVDEELAEQLVILGALVLQGDWTNRVAARDRGAAGHLLARDLGRKDAAGGGSGRRRVEKLVIALLAEEAV